jgi:hypothetical protein
LYLYFRAALSLHQFLYHHLGLLLGLRQLRQTRFGLLLGLRQLFQTHFRALLGLRQLLQALVEARFGLLLGLCQLFDNCSEPVKPIWQGLHGIDDQQPTKPCPQLWFSFQKVQEGLEIIHREGHFASSVRSPVPCLLIR